MNKIFLFLLSLMIIIEPAYSSEDSDSKNHRLIYVINGGYSAGASFNDIPSTSSMYNSYLGFKFNIDIKSDSAGDSLFTVDAYDAIAGTTFTCSISSTRPAYQGIINNYNRYGPKTDLMISKSAKSGSECTSSLLRNSGY
jgi:hypothetical protein